MFSHGEIFCLACNDGGFVAVYIKVSINFSFYIQTNQNTRHSVDPKDQLVNDKMHQVVFNMQLNSNIPDLQSAIEQKLIQRCDINNIV